MTIAKIVEKALKEAGIDANISTEEDNYGQIVLYTGLIQDGQELRRMTDKDFEEEE